MRLSFLLIVSLAAALSLAGCGDNGGGDDAQSGAQSGDSGSMDTQTPSTPDSGTSTEAPAGN